MGYCGILWEFLRVSESFISNSIFRSRLELLMFWAKMRLKVAMKLLRFLTDFGTKLEK